ncbi:hypothetical protein RIR_jg10982.t1 [Rhizophagus irregularis DAOM 181602=DAOM 197198]|nr:hypothetical protein RIR_jg10982.t1 [Rhizophagus irregularis DAOM 181602=DAOM 197198]
MIEMCLLLNEEQLLEIVKTVTSPALTKTVLFWKEKYCQILARSSIKPRKNQISYDNYKGEFTNSTNGSIIGANSVIRQV